MGGFDDGLPLGAQVEGLAEKRVDAGVLDERVLVPKPPQAIESEREVAAQRVEKLGIHAAP